ncbi:PD40 domain-containing protein [Candidatus Fermentibacteria bacterium]|nr:PD40 domain-containing protein [Candidatus Fermentibacteria bacterium]
MTSRVSVILCASILLSSCADDDPTQSYPTVRREDMLPGDIAKRGPETDHHPPILHSPEYESPVPVPGAINTAGAEDSPFILPDGSVMYFFFTPDVRVPVEQQLLDNVTGVWVSRREGDAWGEAERVWLQEPGKLSLDGAVCVQDDEMWFASAREGYVGVNMFTARRVGNTWADWQYVGDRLMKELQIGEVHLHNDSLYFHSPRSGGFGDYDIWVTRQRGGTWEDPRHLAAVNTPEMDGFPFVSSDGRELWFTRTYLGTPAVFRSLGQGDTWGEPELIVSQFAGEPTLDDEGTLYFVHHFYEHGVMIEADIYVARRRG